MAKIDKEELIQDILHHQESMTEYMRSRNYPEGEVTMYETAHRHIIDLINMEGRT